MNPCVSCTPESYCASWSPPDDRRCTTTADCIVTVVKFPDVHCSFGYYGGSVSAVTSHAGEPRVRARLEALDPCQLYEHVRGGSVCAAPPLECVGGLCGYENAPPHIAY
ncbi:MAG: hypothetical protein KF795_03145 [Labilithrix sp.]|nr:hypothetical protein [Labilithrix sp.]